MGAFCSRKGCLDKSCQTPVEVFENNVYVCYTCKEEFVNMMYDKHNFVDKRKSVIMTEMVAFLKTEKGVKVELPNSKTDPILSMEAYFNILAEKRIRDINSERHG
jgi:hypothetical protein